MRKPWGWRRHFAAAGTALLAAGAPPAWARMMHVMQSYPQASAEMAGAGEQFYVRFDGPVDHAASGLAIWRDGQPWRALHPLLDSEPSTLFAQAGQIPAGSYTLHWRAISAPDRAATEGDIPFSVR